MTPRRGEVAVLGIDPGLDGGVAWIFPGRAEARATPTLAAGKGGRRRYDGRAMVDLLGLHPVELAVIEAVGAMPGQGRGSIFHFGEGYGRWQGMLDALRIPYQVVRPQEWKRVVLAGTARDKVAAIDFVARRYPGVGLLATPRSRVPHDGMADALCLAEYGRRLLVGAGGPDSSQAGGARGTGAIRSRSSALRPG